MANFKLFRKNRGFDLNQFLKNIQDQVSFFNRFAIYQEKMGEIKKARERFSTEEKSLWLESLELLLAEASNTALDRQTAEKLTQYVLFAAIHNIDDHESKVLHLCAGLCELSLHFSFDAALLQFTQKFIEPKHPRITLIIYSHLQPSAGFALSFYNKLFNQQGGLQTLQRYAFPHLAHIIPTSFSEPGYSTHKPLLEWLLNHSPNSEWGVAAKLTLGLWRGKYKVLNQSSLDQEFFQYFTDRSSLFAREIQFLIAAICLKVDVLSHFAQNPGSLRTSWAKEYLPLIRAFIESLQGQYPDIGKQAVNSPVKNNFPAPLYTFMLVVYAAYASKYLHANLDGLYAEVRGPWKAYVNQFGIKEFPYRENPDIRKYEQILHSPVASSETKSYIAPWIVELSFYREGTNAAEQKIKSFPQEFQSDAHKRLQALKGVSFPDSPQTENDLMAQIRYAVAKRKTDMLRELTSAVQDSSLHPNELRLCRFTLNFLETPAAEVDDLQEAQSLNVKGLPQALFLAAHKAFQAQDFRQSGKLFDELCPRFPGQTRWREMWAQTLVATQQKEKAITQLSSLKPQLSEDASELLAWCLFTSVFPSEIALVNVALYSGQFLNAKQKEDLAEAQRLLAHSMKPLKNLLVDIGQQIQNPERAPQYENYPVFAQKWLLIRKTICEQKLEQVNAYTQEINQWPEEYQKEVVKKISERKLATLSPGIQQDPEAINTLLQRLGKSKEAFYSTQFYADLLGNLSSSEIYDKYHTIYPEKHPVFNLVILYKAWDEGDMQAVMKIIAQQHSKSAHASILLMKLFHHAKAQNWSEAIDASLNYARKNRNSPILSPLIQWCVQVSILHGNYALKELLQISSKQNIQLGRLDPALLAQLLQQLLSDTQNEGIREIRNLLTKVLDPKYNILLKVAEVRNADFIDQLKDIEAKGKWGEFIARKSLKALLEELKKKTVEQTPAFLQRKIPPLLAFLEKAKENLIREAEIKALKNLEAQNSPHEKVCLSLKGILKINTPEALAGISQGLLIKLNFPKQMKDLHAEVENYIKESANEEKQLDRLAHVANVFSCWLEYLEQQPKILVKQIYRPIFTQLNLRRLSLYTHRNFVDWFVKRRKKLPENQQFIKDAAEYLEVGFYKWLPDLYLKNLSAFFTANKEVMAKLYADEMLKISANGQPLTQSWNIPKNTFDADRGEKIRQAFKNGVENWIKDRKGNLENKMVPSDEMKKEYELDYEKGLKIINRICKIFPQYKDLLVLGLRYANRWNKDHANINGDDAAITENSVSANRIKETLKEYSNFYADALIPLSKAGLEHDFRDENRALAKHFYYKALVENQKKPFAHMEQLLKWASNHKDIFWIYRNRYVSMFNDGKMTPNAARANLQKFLNMLNKDSELYKTIAKDINQLNQVRRY